MLGQVGEEDPESVADRIWADIAGICIKTIIAITPSLKDKYRSYFMIPEDKGKPPKVTQSRCLEILGEGAPPPQEHCNAHC